MINIERLSRGHLPKGTYAIGDLCYMIDIKLWDEMCDTVFIDEREGYFTVGEYVGWYSYTKYGDGLYESNSTHMFPVDAGLIGAIQIEALLDKNTAREDFNLSSLITSKVEKTGILVTKLDNETHPETNRFGTIMIGDIHIYTGENWYEEYEEDE